MSKVYLERSTSDNKSIAIIKIPEDEDAFVGSGANSEIAVKEAIERMYNELVTQRRVNQHLTNIIVGSLHER